MAPSDGERLRVKAGMVCLQCKTCVIHIPELFRGELLTMGRYTNLCTFTFVLGGIFVPDNPRH